jgi:hypothetical protein
MSIGEMRLTAKDLGDMNVFQKLWGAEALSTVAIVANWV